MKIYYGSMLVDMLVQKDTKILSNALNTNIRSNDGTTSCYANYLHLHCLFNATTGRKTIIKKTIKNPRSLWGTRPANFLRSPRRRRFDFLKMETEVFKGGILSQLFSLAVVFSCKISLKLVIT